MESTRSADNGLDHMKKKFSKDDSINELLKKLRDQSEQGMDRAKAYHNVAADLIEHLYKENKRLRNNG